MNIGHINAISCKSVEFLGMPSRQYPYANRNECSSQAQEQMPEVRAEIKKYSDSLDYREATDGIFVQLNLAKKNLAEGREDLAQKNIDKAIKEISNKRKQAPSYEHMEHLLYCSMQSPDQQDKHDSIWLFNRLSENSAAHLPFGIYANMAHVFHKLDKNADYKEIKKAEDNIKDYYKLQDRSRQYFLDENYGFGETLDFTA